jgi:hypothetical protein
MAVARPQGKEIEPPIWPLLDDAALDAVRIDYDPEIDYLYVFLSGEPRHAVWDPRPDGDTWVGLRLVGVGDWTNEVVGIMIEHFRLHVVKVHPRWEDLLDASGATRRQLLRDLIADVAAMTVGAN